MSKKGDPISTLQAAQRMEEMDTSEVTMQNLNVNRPTQKEEQQANRNRPVKREENFAANVTSLILQQPNRYPPMQDRGLASNSSMFFNPVKKEPESSINETFNGETSTDWINEFTSNQPVDNSTFESNQTDWTFESINAMRRSKPSRPTPYTKRARNETIKKPQYQLNNGPRPIGVVGDYFWIPEAPELGLNQAVLVIDGLDVPEDLQQFGEPNYLFRNASKLFPPKAISKEEQLRLRALVQQHREDRDFGKFWTNVTSGKKMEPLNPQGALVYPFPPNRINNQTSDAENIDETFLDTVRYINEPLPLITQCACRDPNHIHYYENPFLKAIKQISLRNDLPIAPLSILGRRPK